MKWGKAANETGNFAWPGGGQEISGSASKGTCSESLLQDEVFVETSGTFWLCLSRKCLENNFSCGLISGLSAKIYNLFSFLL